MAMPIAVPRYRIQDLDAFPDDGNRYELLDGVLLVTPAPALAHQLVVARIAGELVRCLGNHGPARVVSPGSVELEPNVHLEPDILVIPADELAGDLRLDTRWSAIRRWWLAVEVSGAGSLIYDRDHKGPAYLALGVREVWRVDLRARQVFVSRGGQAGETRHDDQVVWRPAELSRPLVIAVPSLFEGIAAG